MKLSVKKPSNHRQEKRKVCHHDTSGTAGGITVAIIGLATFKSARC